MKSNDGKLVITSNKIEMKANDGSFLKLSPTEGFRLIHKYDSQGRVLEETRLNKNGLYKFYSEYNAAGNDICALWSNYLETIEVQTLGGEGWPTLFSMVLDAPPWRDTSKTVYAFVTPNETLRFIESSGGRVGDLKSYVCNIESINQTSAGVTINIRSQKTYVSSVYNNQPVFTTGSMEFNILVICK